MDHTHPWSCGGERDSHLPLRLLSVGGEDGYLNEISVLLRKEECWLLGRQLPVSIRASLSALK